MGVHVTLGPSGPYFVSSLQREMDMALYENIQCTPKSVVHVHFTNKLAISALIPPVFLVKSGAIPMFGQTHAFLAIKTDPIQIFLVGKLALW